MKSIQLTVSKNPDAFRPKLATAAIMSGSFTVGGAINVSSSQMMPQTPKKKPSDEESLEEIKDKTTPEGAIEMTPVTKHFKGCNCRRSYCLKKYCECFQAGVLCTKDCHCVDCKNVEGKRERQDILQLVDSLKTFSPLQSPVKRSRASEFSLGTLDKASL